VEARFLLIAAVGAVGVLHTVVPDHWLPIALLARQEGWSRRETARAAFGAGIGHTVSTLALGVIIWLAGTAFAATFGRGLSFVASLALIGFGLWIAGASLRALRRERAEHAHGHSHPHGHTHGHDHAAEPVGHRHLHRHAGGREHLHYHLHERAAWHPVNAGAAAVVVHEHEHKAAPRTALLLILGSSPMVEGLPAFFAAGRYGVGVLAEMAVVFGASTIVSYVVLCVYSRSGLQRVELGPFERYGEVLSGAFIALVGFVFLVWNV
jgi:hypothetical protein